MSGDVQKGGPEASGFGATLYRRGRYFWLTMLMILALGMSTLLTIGRQEDPTITNLFATVVTPFPGASPERVEALVTEKIEEKLREIAEIDELRSTSSTGISSIQIELSSFLPDDRLDQIWSEIRDALADAAVELPPGVPEPSFDDDRAGAFTAIFAIERAEGRPGTAPLGMATRFGDLLQDVLRRVPGTELVRLYGAGAEEIRVRVDADKIASIGLTADDVAAAIAQADAKVRAGRVRGRAQDLLIEVDGEIETVDRIRQIPLAAGADGRLARVGDVAEVRRALAAPPETIAYHNGLRAVLVAARMEPDLQVDAWMARIQRAAAELERALPDGLRLVQVFDQSGYTAERLGGVAVNLGIGVALVVGVLFLSMGARAALVVALMLPLTALASLFVLEKIGVVIHQMSVTGLVVALGLLVDAAIVMTDEIRRRLAAGIARVEAVAGAARRLALPLAASTATTVLAFLPMALLPGPAGDFVGSIALSVIVMLCVSLLLALTVTPALAGRVLPEPAGAGGAGGRTRWWRDGMRLGAFGRLFAWALRLSLRHRGVSLMAAAAPAIVGFLAFPTLTAQFFPGVDRNQFYVQLTLPEGSAIERTQAAALQADGILRQAAGVAEVQWVIGSNAPAFYYNMLFNQDGKANFAEALVTTDAPATTERLIPVLQARLDRALPGTQALVRGLVQGPPVEAPLEMRIVGQDLEILRGIGAAARRAMSELAAVTHTSADLVGGAPKLVFEFDEEKVRLAGLRLGDVARQLEAMIEGAVGGSLIEGNRELPVRVRLGDADRAELGRIADLVVLPPDARARAADGAFPGVPLRALGRIRVEPAASAIARFEGERVNTVRGYLQRGVLPEEALRALRAKLAAEPLPLPDGYRIEWGGDSDARAETINNLISTLGVVIALSVATIVLTFNSWRLSVIAFVVSGLSMGLSLLALAIFQHPFGIQALIGVIGSIGVSINAAIIIMTALQEDPEAALGDPEAIARVVSASSRHIASTTVTTFGGFLPLILEGGGFWPPFAMAIAGGVLLSAITSFFFVPQAYSLAVGRPATRSAVPGGAVAA